MIVSYEKQEDVWRQDVMNGIIRGAIRHARQKEIGFVHAKLSDYNSKIALGWPNASEKLMDELAIASVGLKFAQLNNVFNHE